MATQSTRGSSPSAVVAPALTRVMLVDDHGILRVGARTLLESTGQFVVCGEADTGASAVEVGTREAPDLIVADLGLPDGGVALIRKLAQLPCHPKVIVLSMYEASLYAQRVIDAGASAYLMKDDASEHLIDIALAVRDGRSIVHPPNGYRTVGKKALRTLPFLGVPKDPLTPREAQVLELIGKGKSSKQVAFDLGLSVRTIDVHRVNIRQKLNLRTGTELVRYAAQMVQGQ